MVYSRSTRLLQVETALNKFDRQLLKTLLLINGITSMIIAINLGGFRLQKFGSFLLMPSR